MDVSCNPYDNSIFVINQNWTIQVFNSGGKLIRQLEIKHKLDVIMNFARISFSPIGKKVVVIVGGTDGEYSYSGMEVYNSELQLFVQRELLFQTENKRPHILSVVFSQRGYVFLSTDGGTFLYDNDGDLANSRFLSHGGFIVGGGFIKVAEMPYPHEHILIKNMGTEFSRLFDAFSIPDSNLSDSVTNLKWVGRISCDENSILCDYSNHQLVLFDQNGQLVQTVGSQGPDVGQLNEPVGMCVSKDKIVVADYVNDRIQIFSTR